VILFTSAHPNLLFCFAGVANITPFFFGSSTRIYFASVDEGLLPVESPVLASAAESGSVGVADCDVILAKFSFSCSGSAWFGLLQAVTASTARVAASNVSLIYLILSQLV
jgi:hypothetical protein